MRSLKSSICRAGATSMFICFKFSSNKYQQQTHTPTHTQLNSPSHQFRRQHRLASRTPMPPAAAQPASNWTSRTTLTGLGQGRNSSASTGERSPRHGEHRAGHSCALVWRGPSASFSVKEKEEQRERIFKFSSLEEILSRHRLLSPVSLFTHNDIERGQTIFF